MAWRCNVVFTPRAKEVLLAELRPGAAIAVPQEDTFLFMHAGDQVHVASLSARTLVVVNRFFAWDEKGDVLIQVMLDLHPDFVNAADGFEASGIEITTPRQ